MKKITLQQQWDALLAEAEQIKQQHLDAFFKTNYKPEVLFEVTRIGQIKKVEIERFTMAYQAEGSPIKHAPWILQGKKPTTKLVEELQSYVNFIKDAPYVVFIHYVQGSFCHGAHRYNTITERSNIAFHEADLESRATINRELYAPREGHQQCDYCGKQTAIDKLIKKKIFGRGRKPVWNSRKGIYEEKACLTEQFLNFCSGTCAGNEQMSREG